MTAAPGAASASGAPSVPSAPSATRVAASEDRVMTPRRWALVALGLASLAWALGSEWIDISASPGDNFLLDLLSGMSFVVAGLVALDRRPGNRLGPLMFAVGFTWYCANWQGVSVGWLLPLLGTGTAAATGLTAHLLLAFPTGRLTNRLERVTVVLIYLNTLGAWLAFIFFQRPATSGCPHACPIRLAPWPSDAVVDAIDTTRTIGTYLLVPLFVAVLVLRWWQATPRRRRELTPLWCAATIIAVVYLIQTVVGNDLTGFGGLLTNLSDLLQIGVPVLFLWGLLSTRLAQSAVGTLVVDLADTPPGRLREKVSRTLGDPSVDIVYASEGGDRWLDFDGGPAALPVPANGKELRRATLVERDGHPLAALIHDPALDAGLVRAVAAAAGMQIENERLHAQIQAQLDEVRASRARIVRAGDEERRRVERNLHDGAQQRLLTLSLVLHSARRQLAAGQAGVVGDTLTRASEGLRQAIDELRELARGIHPTVLADAGLGPALRTLAGRAAVPVALEVGPEERYPATIEATAYYVVSEALANVTKYAKASTASVCVARADGRLTVEISDDGIGGADPALGSGLRGLADRVAAVDGTLTVSSPAGHGTVVRAELPCNTWSPS